MDQELKKNWEDEPQIITPPPEQKKNRPSIQPANIQIALIGAAGFQRHLKKPQSETFITSLSEIEKAIDSLQNLPAEE